MIPPRSGRKTPRERDREGRRTRNQVERFFDRIKEPRKIAFRFEKLLCACKAFVQLAACLLWVRYEFSNTA